MSPLFAYANWTIYSHADEITFYYDKATIKTEGQYRKVWTLVDFKKPNLNSVNKSFKSITTYWMWDCKQERHKILQFTQYSESMAKGMSIRTDSTPANWEYIEPQTVSNTLHKIICSN